MLFRFFSLSLLLAIVFVTSCSPKESEESESKKRGDDVGSSGVAAGGSAEKFNNDGSYLPKNIESALKGLPFRQEREGSFSLTSSRVDILGKYSETQMQEYFGKNISIRECTIEQFRAIRLRDELNICKNANKCKLIVEDVATSFLDLHGAFNDSYRVLQSAAELNYSRYCSSLRDSPVGLP
jgi:hypothetical protein